MANLWNLPNELLIMSLCQNFPGREGQIRVLTTLLCPTFPISKNIVLYGLEATAKSAVTKAVLEKLSTDQASRLKFAVVKSAECITARHLLERTLGHVVRALDRSDYNSRCENLAQLVVELGKLLQGHRDESAGDGSGLCAQGRRFVLVFDGIDRQRDAPGTLLPALARLGEMIPNLTTIFIVTYPRPNFLHTSGVPHVHFTNYTKAQAIKILSLKPGVLFPPESRASSEEDDEQEIGKARQENLEIWTKFCASVWDSLSKHTERDILSFRALCKRLWTPFIQPLLQGTYTTKQFSKLFLAQRSLFQNENILIPNIVSDEALNLGSKPRSNGQLSSTNMGIWVGVSTATGIESQLPYYSRLLLIAAYLCSHNHPRTDILHFSHTSAARRRKKGGGTALTPTSRKPGIVKLRKISRRLIGAQGFALDRWLAVFWTMCDESDGVGRLGGGGGKRTADIEMAIATLGSLRLVVRMGAVGGGLLDREGKWRVLVGLEAVRGLARSLGIEIEDFLGE